MDGGIDENGVDQLSDAHVLQHFLHVLLGHIIPILHMHARLRDTTSDRVDVYVNNRQLTKEFFC